jgi:hypothetical protein
MEADDFLVLEDAVADLALEPAGEAFM